MELVPLFSSDLIEMLDKLYPIPRYVPGDTLESIAYAAGRREIVDTLISKLEFTRKQSKENGIHVFNEQT